MEADSSTLGRLLFAYRKTRRKRCACGVRFTTTGRGLYCSPACRQRAHRLRVKEKANANRVHGPSEPDSATG